MFTKLTDTTKGAIFSVLVLCLAVGAALLIRFLDVTSNLVMFSIWSRARTAGRGIDRSEARSRQQLEHGEPRDEGIRRLDAAEVPGGSVRQSGSGSMLGIAAAADLRVEPVVHVEQQVLEAALGHQHLTRTGNAWSSIRFCGGLRRSMRPRSLCQVHGMFYSGLAQELP